MATVHSSEEIALLLPFSKITCYDTRSRQFIVLTNDNVPDNLSEVRNQLHHCRLLIIYRTDLTSINDPKLFFGNISQTKTNKKNVDYLSFDESSLCQPSSDPLLHLAMQSTLSLSVAKLSLSAHNHIACSWALSESGETKLSPLTPQRRKWATV